MSNLELKELQTLLKRRPDLAAIELLIADVNGILRGKRIRPREFEKVFAEGFAMPGGTVLLDGLGDVPEGVGWATNEGDPDLPASIVPGSLALVPWTDKPTAQAMFRLSEDGKPFALDPRSVLERTVRALRRRCPTICMAAELEFYLLDASAPRPRPRRARIPGLDRRQPGPQVYVPEELADVEAFLDELHDTCEQQGIPTGTTTAEFAPGQFEVNLTHVDDPVLACDHAVLLKRAIKAVARRHGFAACFMAKPFSDQPGSGLHLHVSFYDKLGKNYFSRGKASLAKPPYSDRLRQAVGGLQQTMSDATLIFAPNANSYRRLRPDSFAPVRSDWGDNHRGVALRIPTAEPRNLRVEHRTAGADANPYLVAAAVLAGVEHGLRERTTPGAMVATGQTAKSGRRLPDRWTTAMDRFGRSRVLKNALGEGFCRSYLGQRRCEEQRFHNQVADVDYEWYLRAL